MGRAGQPPPPGAQMKVPGGAGRSPRGTMQGLFFVCAAAVNTTRAEEPKTEPNLKWKAPSRCWGPAPAVPASPGGDQGLANQGHLLGSANLQVTTSLEGRREALVTSHWSGGRSSGRLALA